MNSSPCVESRLTPEKSWESLQQAVDWKQCVGRGVLPTEKGRGRVEQKQRHCLAKEVREVERQSLKYSCLLGQNVGHLQTCQEGLFHLIL